MTLTLAELGPGTLVALQDGKFAVITAHKQSNYKNPLILKMAASSKTYKASLDMVKAVIGLVRLDALEAVIGSAPTPARGTDSDSIVPPQLRGIKIGDSIVVRTRRGTKTVTYGGYNTRRPKFPLSYTCADGRLPPTTDRRQMAPAPRPRNTASTSTCGVCGNRSKAVSSANS